MTTIKTRPGLLPDGVTVVDFVVTQGIHPDADSIRNDVADLLHLGNQICQFGHSLRIVAACLHEISDGHNRCDFEDCPFCSAIYSATSIIQALDVINATALWPYTDDGRAACGHEH